MLIDLTMTMTIERELILSVECQQMLLTIIHEQTIERIEVLVVVMFHFHVSLEIRHNHDQHRIVDLHRIEWHMHVFQISIHNENR
jgi:hypothetical protein